MSFMGTSKACGPSAPADVIARALRRDALERVVEGIDAHLRPGAILRMRHGRHHLFVHVGQEGVVDLHIQAGIDDGLVFLVQAVGERPQQALLVGIVFVLGIWQRACRRDDRKESARDLGFGGGGLAVGDVALTWTSE